MNTYTLVNTLNATLKIRHLVRIINSNEIFSIQKSLYFILLTFILPVAMKAQSPLCVSSPSSYCCEYVSEVNINGAIRNGAPASTAYTSGPGYFDYTSEILTTMEAGSTYPVSVTVNTNSLYQEFVKIWFDFNGNNTLTDAGELVFDQVNTINGSYVFSGNITVPADAFNGEVYVRVVMVYANIPELCGYYSFGTTLDFKVLITEGIDSEKITVSTTELEGYNGSVTSIPAGINTSAGIFSSNFATGSTVLLTATPDNGGIFIDWSGDVSGEENPLEVQMDGSKTIVANFGTDCIETESPAFVEGVAIDTNSAVISWASATGSGPITYYWAVGTTPSVTYKSGYLERGITTSTSVVTSVLEKSSSYYASVRALNSCSASSYTVSEVFQTHHAVNYYTEGSGYIEGEQNQSVADQMDASEVYAVAENGYRFIGWSDGSTDNPRTDLHVTESMDITAYFGFYSLEFVQQPLSGAAGEIIPVEIRIVDENHNTITTANTTITLGLYTNPTSAILLGATTVETINGIAVFNDITIQKAGIGYTLMATSNDIMQESTSFDVFAAEAHHLELTGIQNPHPYGEVQSVTITAYDEFQNLKTDYTGTVAFTSSDEGIQNPGIYTFVLTDHGTKLFENAIRFSKAGNQNLIVSDISNTAISGVQNILIQTLPLTIAANNRSKTYGNYLPAGNTEFAILSGQLAAGESITSVSMACTGFCSTANAGNYSISISGAMGIGGFNENNYSITYANTGILSVTKRQLLIEAQSGQQKTYGTTDPRFDFSATGFADGDNSTILTGSLSRTQGEDAGFYQILLGTLNAGNNYNIDFTSSLFGINQKAIHVIADAKAKECSSPDPLLTYTYSPELIGNDAFSGFLTRESGETPGEYFIFQNTLTLGSNYIIDFEPAFMVITDHTRPVLVTPANNYIAECNGVGNLTELNQWLLLHAGASATDNCGDIFWTNNYNPTNAQGNDITVTFTASDDFGNTESTTAHFIIRDTTAPILVTPASSVTLECDGQGNPVEIETWLHHNGGAVATDICSESIRWHNNYNALNFQDGTAGYALVTFTATDEAGNSVSTSASLTITDNTAPIIPQLPDVTGECSIVINPPTTTDICGGIIVGTTTDTLTYSTQTSGIIHWTFTDNTGNQSFAEQHFSVLDITPPVVLNCASDIMGCAGETIFYQIPTAIDNCSSNVIVEQIEGPISGSILPEGEYLARFRFTDEAGNFSLCSFYIKIAAKPDATTTITGTTITANTPGAAYQWLDCSNGYMPIPNETDISFTPEHNGSYAVIVTNASCSDTSECVLITTVDLPENAVGDQLSIYPNPANEKITISTGIATTIQLMDINGKILLEEQIEQNKTIPIHNLPKGMYTIRNSQGRSVKLIKN